MTTLFESLYAQETPLQILFVTCLIGGGAAWATGRALADTWRPFWQTLLYSLLLGTAVRFVHFALFQGELLSLRSYMTDTAFLILVGGLSWRFTRTTRMVNQYRWLYERTGPFTWRNREILDNNNR